MGVSFWSTVFLPKLQEHGLSVPRCVFKATLPQPCIKKRHTQPRKTTGPSRAISKGILQTFSLNLDPMLNAIMILKLVKSLKVSGPLPAESWPWIGSSLEIHPLECEAGLVETHLCILGYFPSSL